MAKRQQEGDYDEGVVAKSKSVRNLVSRSSAGPSTTAIFDCFFPVGFKDLEMRIEIRGDKPSYNNQPENLSKRDRVTNSQGRHEETRLRGHNGIVHDTETESN